MLATLTKHVQQYTLALKQKQALTICMYCLRCADVKLITQQPIYYDIAVLKHTRLQICSRGVQSICKCAGMTQPTSGSPARSGISKPSVGNQSGQERSVQGVKSMGCL